MRSALVITDNSTAVHQGRLHALTRDNYTPGFFDLERIANSATSVHVSQAESRIALQAIGCVIKDRKAAAPAALRPPAAVARSGQTAPLRARRPRQNTAHHAAPP
ncbi:hypothetical protein MHW47_00915 [Streptomyces sp. OfavH-34-F]|uniref:hypothetical protein n=1 Tax=Streptomyces sp. OfavH-34-F TaxID=2917760 RepID=UPI001EF1D054|nr:hypothetical protein [Streptomyces sp. OfavH-34-F]MCG7523017.1 hypothetical protein [Streptomyces sp. OfavH-34-F]